MTFGVVHLERLADLVGDVWLSAAGRDWTVPAATPDWSCGRTADHAVDTVFAPAFFLASRKLDRYPSYAQVRTPGAEAEPELLVEALQTAVRMLVAVVRAAEPEAKAIIWSDPPEVRGPADCVPRGGMELLLHAHDVCSGLRVEFQPPEELCEAIRQHTLDWPYWTRAPGWRPPAMAGPAWPAPPGRIC